MTPPPEGDPFEGSKVQSEHFDATNFFQEHQELIEPVRGVFHRFGVADFPCKTGDSTQYWQAVVKHYVHTPNPDYDELDPFYVVDLGRVIAQMAKFRKNLPMVQPHYAVKCNPTPALLAMISALGGSFDCASYQEFKTVIESGYASPDNIIFANPAKSCHDIRKAQEMGVRYVTFDNLEELDKLSLHMPSAKAVLRLATNDSAAVCAFSTKFGAHLEDVPELLRHAKELGVCVVGVSFHVGSGNNDPRAYIEAINNAHDVFQQGISLDYEMKLLDIGGGFPGTEPPLDSEGKPSCLSFEEIAEHIRPLLETLFPTATIIAEPGRYFSASTHCLAMNVHSTRRVLMPNGEYEHQYYVNDGLYNSFNCIAFDHAHPCLNVLEADPESTYHITTIYGPTCDSLDCILKRQWFPSMERGEWLFVPDMGSYTTAAGSAFNGFQTRRTEYISSVRI